MQRARNRSPRFRPRTWDPDANYGQVYGRPGRTFPRLILRFLAIAIVLVAGAGTVFGAPKVAFPGVPILEGGAGAPNVRVVQSADGEGSPGTLEAGSRPPAEQAGSR